MCALHASLTLLHAPVWTDAKEAAVGSKSVPSSEKTQSKNTTQHAGHIFVASCKSALWFISHIYSANLSRVHHPHCQALLGSGPQGHSVSALRDLHGNQSGLNSGAGWELRAGGVITDQLHGVAWTSLEGEGVASEV